MPDKAPMRARYIGYTKGTENHGDEALIWIIRDLLAPEIEVCADAAGPNSAACDIALLGGGTLINQSPWLIDSFARELDQCKRGVVFGTGVGDTAFWGDHFAAWNKLLKRCSHVGVRGPNSLRLLREHGFRDADAVGDPYLAIQPPTEYRPTPRRIAINVGSTNASLHGGDEPGFLKAVSALAELLRARGWSIIWVSVWSKDLEILRVMREMSGSVNEPLYDARNMSLETLSAIASCEVFLGEKLHALAMSAVAGTPFLAWEYQPKVRDFAASIGMEDLVVSTAVRSPGEMGDRIEALSRTRQAVAAVLRRETTVRRDSIRAFAARIRRWAAESTG